MNEMTITISGCRPSLVPIDSDLALALNPDQPAVVQLDPPKQLIVSMLSGIPGPAGASGGSAGGTFVSITGASLIFPDPASPSGYSRIVGINSDTGLITYETIDNPQPLRLLTEGA